MSDDAVLADRRLSAAEAIRHYVEGEVSSGALLPGDAIDEDALASRFGVSRTPVREALLQLSVRGLVTIAPRAGIYVSRLSIPELMSLLELLAELEGACAKLATRRMTKEEGETLRRVHEESKAYEEQEDAQAYSRANAQFHEILYRACRNEALMTEIAHIRRRTQVYRQTVFQNQLRIRRSREDHGHIVEAILSGDEAAAYQHMIEHIAVGGRDFADLLSHVPQRLLAAEADFPGRRASERRRVEAAEALGARAGAKRDGGRRKPAPAAPARAKGRGHRQSSR
jgi:DNA-binding GntR family transcriptional regulator